jgi:hypothetical protein
VGSDRNIIGGGKTSGIPPTDVETDKRLQDAASRILIQNDSVNEVFKKIWP